MKVLIFLPILAYGSVPDRSMHWRKDSEPDYDMTKPLSGPSVDFEK